MTRLERLCGGQSQRRSKRACLTRPPCYQGCCSKRDGSNICANELLWVQQHQAVPGRRGQSSLQRAEDSQSGTGDFRHLCEVEAAVHHLQLAVIICSITEGARTGGEQGDRCVTASGEGTHRQAPFLAQAVARRAGTRCWAAAPVHRLRVDPHTCLARQRATGLGANVACAHRPGRDLAA